MQSLRYKIIITPYSKHTRKMFGNQIPPQDLFENIKNKYNFQPPPTISCHFLQADDHERGRVQGK
jgi:hypothetical protein